MNKLNKSFIYVFPVFYKDFIRQLELPYGYFKEYIFDDLVNTYCFIDDKEVFTQNIFIVEMNISEKSKVFLEDCKKCSNFVNVTQKDNSITIGFHVNKGFSDCYYKFIAGKYSTFFDMDKSSIMAFLLTFLKTSSSEGVNLIRHVNGVLKRAEWLRVVMQTQLETTIDYDMELSSIIDARQETYIL